jgi:hypothetical protein
MDRFAGASLAADNLMTKIATGCRPSRKGKRAKCTPSRDKWEPRFLAALAESSNVTGSADAADITVGYVYKLRRIDPAFAARWRQALLEGYEHLEMETLCHLRGREPTDRKFDVASALRAMSAHRQAIAAERALRDEEDEQSVLDSIDRMIEEMRERSAANAAILAEDDDAAA